LEINEVAKYIAIELCEKAVLKPGQTVIIGCSTSEVCGHHIGSHSNAEIGITIFDELHKVFDERGIIMAVQCCEHLNRAIITERKDADDQSIVNVVPTIKAGGAFAVAAYERFKDPVALESFQADAGFDIGGTLIGMHLKRVAVPLRLEVKQIGEAAVTAARTRPPMIGGSRASYDDSLM